MTDRHLTHLRFRITSHARYLGFLRFVLLCAFVPLFQSNAQTLDWSNLHGGVMAEWSLPTGDFHRHWNNGIGGGVHLQYDVSHSFGVVGTATLSRFEVRNESARDTIPGITLLKLSAGVMTKRHLIGPVTGLLEGSLSTFTFVFTGAGATRAEENLSESELGFALGAGVEIAAGERMRLGIMVKQRIALSSPETIGLWDIGISLTLF